MNMGRGRERQQMKYGEEGKRLIKNMGRIEK